MKESDKKLQGKVAIVTGASRGIGFAVARAFAAEGASVAICSRTSEAIEKAARDIGPTALGMAADVSDAGQVSRFVALASGDISLPNGDRFDLPVKAASGSAGQ